MNDDRDVSTNAVLADAGRRREEPENQYAMHFGVRGRQLLPEEVAAVETAVRPYGGSVHVGGDNFFEWGVPFDSGAAAYGDSLRENQRLAAGAGHLVVNINKGIAPEWAYGAVLAELLDVRLIPCEVINTLWGITDAAYLNYSFTLDEAAEWGNREARSLWKSRPLGQ
ncbi:MAG: hypothetical protein L0H93_02540 [Nocardioides sp.]|nr:hypothetical protein [Nocardioides sp.]